jgi:hypothetical protein
VAPAAAKISTAVTVIPSRYQLVTVPNHNRTLQQQQQQTLTNVTVDSDTVAERTHQLDHDYSIKAAEGSLSSDADGETNKTMIVAVMSVTGGLDSKADTAANVTTEDESNRERNGNKTVINNRLTYLLEHLL